MLYDSAIWALFRTSYYFEFEMNMLLDLNNWSLFRHTVLSEAIPVVLTKVTLITMLIFYLVEKRKSKTVSYFSVSATQHYSTFSHPVSNVQAINKFCVSCGNPLPVDHAFCGSCGRAR